MKTPNYHDFYQMALVPIGLNDLTSLKQSNAFSHEAVTTHWLIAVEGVQLPQPKIYFHWKVTVYPADCSGEFNWKKPFYSSVNMEWIDEAISLASSLVAFSKKDQLSTVSLENIC